MQTFLPYESFASSAQVLDYKRLGKQRVEVLQIYNTLLGQSKGWRNHPAIKMWRGHEKALLLYGIAICREWRHRGYKDSLLERFELEFSARNGPLTYPSWLGMPNFHESHKSNLVRKNPEWYKKHWPEVPEDLPYIWPTCCCSSAR